MAVALASVTGASARLNPVEILFVRGVPQRLDAKRYPDSKRQEDINSRRASGRHERRGGCPGR